MRNAVKFLTNFFGAAWGGAMGEPAETACRSLYRVIHIFTKIKKKLREETRFLTEDSRSNKLIGFLDA